MKPVHIVIQILHPGYSEISWINGDIKDLCKICRWFAVHGIIEIPVNVAKDVVFTTRELVAKKHTCPYNIRGFFGVSTGDVFAMAWEVAERNGGKVVGFDADSPLRLRWITPI